jgi:hypothetical protein
VAARPSLLLNSGFRLDRSSFALALLLRPQDAAPLLVLGYRHTAFNADTHALLRLGFARKEFPERHQSPRSANCFAGPIEPLT